MSINFSVNSPSPSSFLASAPIESKKEINHLADFIITANSRSYSSEDLSEKKDVFNNKWLEEARTAYPEFEKLMNAPAIQYSIGLDYFEGESRVKQNNFKALFWIAKAAEGGDHRALYRLGFWHVHGTIVSQSYVKAKELLIKSASLKNSDAMKLLRYLRKNKLIEI